MRPRVAACNVGRSLSRGAAVGLLAVSALVPPASAVEPPAGPPELLSTDHPAWQDVEALWNRGGLAGLPLFTRPLPRLDIAAALAADLRDRPNLASLGPARRLAREFAWEMERLGSSGPFRETPAPLDLSDGEARLRGRSQLRLETTTTGDEGEVAPGTRAGAVFRAYLPGKAFALADVSIEKIVDSNPIGDAIVKNSDWYLSSREAYVAWRTVPVDLFAGFSRNRWGPGGSGTLLLSDAALDYPALGFARTFGERGRFVALTGELYGPETDADGALRAGTRRWLAAHRLELRLGSRVRLGLHESAAYHSEGLEPLYLVGIVPYTLVQRWLDRATAESASTAPQRNNVMAGLDVVWRIGRGLRLDGEFLVDDFATESASQPDRLGWQTGVSWAGWLGGEAADARAEFVKVTRYTYAVFYDADFVLDGVPLGYGSGPDVEHGEAWLERDLGTDARTGAGVEWTRKGEGIPGDPWKPGDGGSRGSGSVLSGVVERRIFPHVRFRGSWRDVAEVRVQAGLLDVRNRGHVDGDDDRSLHVRAVARVEW